ncbi:hypothetical protein J4760_10660 [Salinicoccus sp. ID82-1]|uniref:hypothetical protein n=1 Tax=Salinicoccus sp. ID82-1 TaxID=2820269 RepID=UPI001F19867F|nr:hypothetical protein [Salinicoccus sp. ID82-1]MCG1010480.1 hypothetical protein [Salinicoccus sp. ID82-1]
MFETFTIGNFSLPSIYMAILLSLIVSYLMLWDSDEKRELFNRWTNGLIILFLVYKLTYIVFSWTEFINNPLGVLYFDGGAPGLLIGMVIAFIYLFYVSKGLFYVEAFCIFSVSFLAFYGILEIRSLMQWHYTALAVITLAALISIYFLWRRFRVIFAVTVAILIMHLIARFFVYSGIEMLTLSIIQWWILLSLIYLIAVTSKDTEDE